MEKCSMVNQNFESTVGAIHIFVVSVCRTTSSLSTDSAIHDYFEFTYGWCMFLFENYRILSLYAAYNMLYGMLILTVAFCWAPYSKFIMKLYEIATLFM